MILGCETPSRRIRLYRILYWPLLWSKGLDDLGLWDSLSKDSALSNPVLATFVEQKWLVATGGLEPPTPAL